MDSNQWPKWSDDNLIDRIIDLEQKYNSLLLDVKHLEEENIETTNELYRLENRIDSIINYIPDNYDLTR